MKKPINTNESINKFLVYQKLNLIYLRHLIFSLIIFTPLLGISQTTYTFHTAGNWTDVANWSPSYPGTTLNNCTINVAAHCYLDDNIFFDANVIFYVNSQLEFPPVYRYITMLYQYYSLNNSLIIGSTGSIIGGLPFNYNSIIDFSADSATNSIINNGTITNMYFSFWTGGTFINNSFFSGGIDVNSLTNNYGTIDGSIGVGNGNSFNNDGSIYGSIYISDGTFINSGVITPTEISFVDRPWFNFTPTFSNLATISGNPTITNHDINGSYYFIMNINSNSTITPGNSSGMIHFDLLSPYNGCVNIPIFECEINGSSPVSQYDQIEITNCANLSNATLNVAWGFTPSVGQTFDIITHGSRTGQFASVNIPPIAGLSFVVDYTDPSKTSIVVSQALPITLNNFNVIKKINDINLHWQTSSEINSHFFDIEYSTDGTDFTAIGREEGAGNSNTLLDYHFEHKDVGTGMHYYRLKQVDYDGQYTYSDIVSVLMKGVGNDVSIYPNPTSDVVNILGMKNGRYEIRDFSDKMVRSGDFISSVLSLEGLSAGIYFVSLTNSDLNGVFKVHKL